MAKDKRLLICRSIILHAQRLVAERKVDATKFPSAQEIPVFMEFTVPPKVLQTQQELAGGSGAAAFSSSSSSSSSSVSKALQGTSLSSSAASLGTGSNNQQQQQPSKQSTLAIDEKTFLLPHSVVAAKTGRATILIVSQDIAIDCAKINKRYGLYDAVVTLESLLDNAGVSTNAAARAGGGAAAAASSTTGMGQRKAALAAATFSRFVFDERIVSKLPRCLRVIAQRSAGPAATASHATVKLLPDLDGEDRHNLVFVLRQAAQGTCVEFMEGSVPISSLTAHRQQQPGEKGSGGAGGNKQNNNNNSNNNNNISNITGALRVRIGHGGMTAGDLTENGKEFIKALRAEFPQIARAIYSVNLTTPVTRQIQWFQLQL